MIDYLTWLEHAKKEMPEHLPDKPLEKNNQGGFDPESKNQIKRYKHVDLITLPEDVKGTNCGNCYFIRNQGKVGFCTHPEIHEWVTDRMCCSYWDSEGARRSWGKNHSGT